MRRFIQWGALALAVVTGCASPNGLKDEGDACVSTPDCEIHLECVVVDNDNTFCLPRPPERVERSCAVDDDCLLSDGQLWPLEAECLDGACRCLGAEVPCAEDEDGDTFGVILEEETCRCVTRGNEGDPCITSHTCDIGLACSDRECRSAQGELGSACRTGDCDTGSCSEFREANDVGICR